MVGTAPDPGRCADQAFWLLRRQQNVIFLVSYEMPVEEWLVMSFR
jgi:hypothetical protein